MILDFPSPASTGTIYTGTNSVIYYYDGEKWTAQGGIGGGGGNADTGSWTFDTVTATTDGNIIVKAGSGADAWASLLSNNGSNSFWVDDVGAHVTSNFIEGETTENYWTFGTDGSLAFPTADMSFEYFVPTLISKDQIIFSTYDAGNSTSSYAVSTQNNNSWEAFAEDDETGAHEAWAYIRAVLPTVDTPTVFIQNRKGVDGINYDWVFDADGKLTAPGHIIPNADLTYDLGSTTTQWRSIYVGTGTIYIGGVALGVNENNYVTVDGNPIITVNTAGNLTVQGNTNIVLGAVVMSDTAPDATTPGSQWFNTVDGRTYIAYNGVWLDASPAQIPSPETYLDDIQIDGSTLSVGDYAWTFGGVTDTFPGDIYDAEGPIVRFATTSTTPTRANGQLWFNSEEGRTYIKYNGAWVDANPTQIPSPETYLDDIQVDGSEFIINGYSLTVDATGTLLVDGQQVTGGGSNGWQLTSGTAVVSLSTSGVLTLPAGSSRVTSYGQLTIETDNGGSGMYANATGVNLLYANTNVTLRSNSTGTTNDWTFGADGILTLSTASTILGNGEDPNVYIETSTTSTTSTWTFGTNGILTLPAATPIIKGGGTGTDVTIIATTGTNTSTWTFGADGNLTFPDATVQTTAWTGTVAYSNVTGAPPTTTYASTYTGWFQAAETVVQVDTLLARITSTGTMQISTTIIETPGQGSAFAWNGVRNQGATMSAFGQGGTNWVNPGDWLDISATPLDNNFEVATVSVFKLGGTGSLYRITYVGCTSSGWAVNIERVAQG